MMDNEVLALMIQCKRNPLSEDIRIQVRRVDTGEAIRLNEGIFLLRISREENMMRCLIRHVSSGREAYFQGGQKLRTFVKACIMQGSQADPPAPDISTT